MTVGALRKILMLVAVASFFSASCVSSVNESDILLAFKKGLTAPDCENQSGPNCIFDSWVPGNQVCTFAFVSCDENNNAIRLDLSNQQISGKLVSDLGNLQYLDTLSLQQNNFRGNIPWELGNLQRLETLDLHDNQLIGRLPSSLGNLKNLVSFHIQNNQLTGQIPKEITSLPKLTDFKYSGNDLTNPPPGGF